MNPKVRRYFLQGGTGLVSAALLVLAMWLYGLVPKIEAETTEPIRSHGRIGQVVKNRTFDMRVERVEAARSMKAFSKQIRTDGVFLIVHARVHANRATFSMGEVVLETPAGYSYRKSPRIGLNDSFLESFEPLLAKPMTAVFELPADRLTGARLIFSEGGRISTQLSAEASVDLGLTPAKATQLIAEARDGYELKRN